MATKKEEMTYGSCFQAAGDDEPLFILRAQDLMAPALVRMWADMLKIVHTAMDPSYGGPSSSHFVQGEQLGKIEEAQDLAMEMEAWQHEHGARVPD